MKVRNLREKVCNFCTIDTAVNKVYFETDHWVVMENTMAPRGGQRGQDHQFVIPSRRHVFSLNELSEGEIGDLAVVTGKIDKDFGIDGGVFVIRSGNPTKNARSMPHLHVNYHVPTGLERVEITIAKSSVILKRKSQFFASLKKCGLWKNRAMQVHSTLYLWTNSFLWRESSWQKVVADLSLVHRSVWRDPSALFYLSSSYQGSYNFLVGRT